MSDTEVQNEFVQALKDMNGHEIRTLKWKVKTLGKQIGRASATIYQLRNENAALRAGLQVNPGDYARVFNQLRVVQAEVRTLRAQLAEAWEAKGENVSA